VPVPKPVDRADWLKVLGSVPPGTPVEIAAWLIEVGPGGDVEGTGGGRKEKMLKPPP